jgi:hypothetical protein
MSTEVKEQVTEMALVEVMGEIKKIEKDQYNEFHKFKYAGIDQIYTACRDALVRAGVMMIPRVTEMEIREVKTKKGESANHCILHVEFTFYKDERKTEPITWVGEAIDVGDKTLSKALSFAEKTLLNGLFMIPRVDEDPDGGGYEATSPEPYQKGKKSSSTGKGGKRILYNVLSIFSKDGLDWLKDKNSEEYGMFKHFLVSRCRIYDTYILEYTEEQCKTVLKEFCKVVQIKELSFPIETKYIEMFRKYYTQMYSLERLELVEGKEEKVIFDGDEQ